jgi:hypothetical protein
MAQQTAVEWLASEINSRGPKENNPPQWLQELYDKAKEMEKQQRNSLLLDIDIELAKIEDYAHGDVGSAITELRGKIQTLNNL